MKTIIKETKNDTIEETVIEDVYIVEHGYLYGIHGSNYEYLELWKNSVRPYIRVKLDGKTEIMFK